MRFYCIWDCQFHLNSILIQRYDKNFLIPITNHSCMKRGLTFWKQFLFWVDDFFVSKIYPVDICVHTLLLLCYASSPPTPLLFRHYTSIFQPPALASRPIPSFIALIASKALQRYPLSPSRGARQYTLRGSTSLFWPSRPCSSVVGVLHPTLRVSSC